MWTTALARSILIEFNQIHTTRNKYTCILVLIYPYRRWLTPIKRYWEAFAKHFNSTERMRTARQGKEEKREKRTIKKVLRTIRCDSGLSIITSNSQHFSLYRTNTDTHIYTRIAFHSLNCPNVFVGSWLFAYTYRFRHISLSLSLSLWLFSCDVCQIPNEMYIYKKKSTNKQASVRFYIFNIFLNHPIV